MTDQPHCCTLLIRLQQQQQPQHLMQAALGPLCRCSSSSLSHQPPLGTFWGHQQQLLLLISHLNGVGQHSAPLQHPAAAGFATAAGNGPPELQLPQIVPQSAWPAGNSLQLPTISSSMFAAASWQAAPAAAAPADHSASLQPQQALLGPRANSAGQLGFNSSSGEHSVLALPVGMMRANSTSAMAAAASKPLKRIYRPKKAQDLETEACTSAQGQHEPAVFGT